MDEIRQVVFQQLRRGESIMQILYWFQSIEENKSIIYEKIDLIKPEKKEDMIQDLRDRTGLPIHEVKVDKIDFLKDVANITIYYNKE